MAIYSTRNIKINLSGTINKTIENLHIKATIDKSLTSIPNQANILIYNLNADSRDILFNTDNIKIDVLLDNNVMFSGKIMNSESVYQNADAEWLTTIQARDIIIPKTNKEKIKTFAKGTTKNEIIDSIAKDLGSNFHAVLDTLKHAKNKECLGKSILKSLTIGTGNAFVSNGIESAGDKFLQNIKALLNKCFGKEIDLFVEDGNIKALPKDHIVRLEPTIINSGLVEPPTLKEASIELKSILINNLKIGQIIKVENKSYNVAIGNLTMYRPARKSINGQGTYKILEISHEFDNFSNDVATTEIKGVTYA